VLANDCAKNACHVIETDDHVWNDRAYSSSSCGKRGSSLPARACVMTASEERMNPRRPTTIYVRRRAGSDGLRRNAQFG
jgi:hypothetical protein